MLKKIFKIVKLFIIGGLWTLLLACFIRWIMIRIWQFDIFYKKQWSVIAGFWNNNGIIIGASDYMLFVVLLLSLIIWICGWILFYKVSYVSILTKPINYIADRAIKKYETQDNHIVFKNISVAEKTTLEDIIQERIQKEKNKELIKEAEHLRKNISEKIIKRKEQ